MQGILILGGLGKRLNLFTRRVNNKALALVYDRLVLEYPLSTLVRAGIDDIVLVLGGRYAGHIMDVVGDGKEFGVKKLTYVYQKDPKGISDAIYQAKDAINNKCAVILGDNFFEDDIKPHVEKFEKEGDGCCLFVKEVPDPERYGVAEIDASKNHIGAAYVTNLVEKPSNPKTNLAATGLYLYDKTLFDRIEKLEPSARGELEVTDLNKSYLVEKKCQAVSLKGYWNDLGTFESLLEVGNFIKNNKFKLPYEISAWD